MSKSINYQRTYQPAKMGSKELGPLSFLPGKWKGELTGWNMIALPFGGAPFKYRILMNQYDEELEFTFVGDNVENRGLKGVIDCPDNPDQNSPLDDQFVVTLDYQQVIRQRVAEDFPDSGGLAGGNLKEIHHEPGLWLFMKNLRSKDKDIKGVPGGGIEITDEVIKVARLASIPHGNSVLALGTADRVEGMPDIPPISGLPIGRFEEFKNRSL